MFQEEILYLIEHYPTSFLYLYLLMPLVSGAVYLLKIKYKIRFSSHILKSIQGVTYSVVFCIIMLSSSFYDEFESQVNDYFRTNFGELTNWNSFIRDFADELDSQEFESLVKEFESQENFYFIKHNKRSSILLNSFNIILSIILFAVPYILYKLNDKLN